MSHCLMSSANRAQKWRHTKKISDGRQLSSHVPAHVSGQNRAHVICSTYGAKKSSLIPMSSDPNTNICMCIWTYVCMSYMYGTTHTQTQLPWPPGRTFLALIGNNQRTHTSCHTSLNPNSPPNQSGNQTKNRPCSGHRLPTQEHHHL